jgi:hypothetical protein
MTAETFPQITVTVRRFNFETRQDPEYRAILADAKARGVKLFDALGDVSELPKDGAQFAVTLNPKTVFSNQFSADKGPRLFDLRVLSQFNACGNRIPRRVGYYIEPDSEYAKLQEFRATWTICGYCGARHPAKVEPGPHWCDRCAGSEYLKPGDLQLLELRPLSEYMPKRNAEPPAELVERYRKAQAETSKRKTESGIARKLAKLEQEKQDAEIEATFLRAVAGAGLAWRHIDNLIFYAHTGRFCFGWRHKLEDPDVAEIKAALRAAGLVAPPVDFKTTGGKPQPGDTFRTLPDAVGKLESPGTFGGGATFTFPAGLRCRPVDESGRAFFLEDFREHVESYYHHDATHRGIRIDAEHVERIPGKR